MATSYTANLNMSKPSVGGDANAWGTMLNADLDTLDAIFKADGTGTQVGINPTAAAVALIAKAAGALLFPVGSIYSNYSNSTNPATLLGFGTWVAIGATMLAGYQAADANFGTPGGTGGSRDAIVVNHTHTASSSVTDPAHTHGVTDPTHAHNFGIYLSGNAVDWQNPLRGSSSNDAASKTYTTNAAATGIGVNAASTGVSVSTTVNAAGASATGANLPPYTTVYLWRRTA